MSEEIRTKFSKATFSHWTFDTDLMNVIKYRVMKLKQQIDKKIQNAKEDMFDCPNCKKSFAQMEVYTKGYKCPFDQTPLKKKDKECANPEKLRKESNKIFSSFETTIKELDDFVIPKEFFGFKLINRPNFNIADSGTAKHIKNQLTTFKEPPNVKFEFETLKYDIYKDLECLDDKAIKDAKTSELELFNFYCQKTKERLVQAVKSLGKKVNKRKRKEIHKKMIASGECD